MSMSLTLAGRKPRLRTEWHTEEARAYASKPPRDVARCASFDDAQRKRTVSPIEADATIRVNGLPISSAMKMGSTVRVSPSAIVMLGAFLRRGTFLQECIDIHRSACQVRSSTMARQIHEVAKPRMRGSGRAPERPSSVLFVPVWLQLVMV